MTKKVTEERPFPWIIKDFQPVKSEPHPRGVLLTDASGLQIIRTHPGRIKIGDKYFRVPSQDYIAREKSYGKIKDVRCPK